MVEVAEMVKWGAIAEYMLVVVVGVQMTMT